MNPERYIFPLLIASVALPAMAQLPTPKSYEWAGIGPLREARFEACAVRVTGGDILVIGGQGNAGSLASVEAISLEGLFTLATPLQHARAGHTCTALPGGSVLVTGGRDANGPLGSAELYADGQWITLAAKPLARHSHTATLLSSGQVLLAGGKTSSGPSDALEAYDPASKTFRTLDARLTTGRTGHTATAISDGTVLLAGGWDGEKVLATVDRFKELDESVSAAAPLPGPRRNHSSTLLLDGRVLIAGGNDGSDDLASALLYQPRLDTYSQTASLQTGRSRHMAHRLPGNGGVIIAGGISEGSVLRSSEVFHPVSERFVPAGELLAPRTDAVIAAIEDNGTVVLLGGLVGGVALATAGATTAPSLTLDRATYVPGAQVNVTGNAFPANSPVTLTISGTRPDGSIAYSSDLTVTTNQFGKLTLSFFASAAGLGLANKVSASGSGFFQFSMAFSIQYQTTCSIGLFATTQKLGVGFDVKVFVTPVQGLAVTGNMNLFVDSILNASQPGAVLSDGTLRATFLPTPLIGNHTLRVVYGGDANYGSCNTGLINVTVQKRNTYPRLLFQRGDISRQPNAITLGESIDLFGVIEDEFLSPVPGPPVTGYVGFERGNSYTVKTLSPTTSTVPISSSATVPFSALQVGPFTVRLRYEGDANYAASEILVNGQINPANTLTRISSNRLNLTLGQSATVSATVTAPVGGIAPAGGVTIRNGNVSLGSASLSATDVRFEYQASRAVTPTTAGGHVYTARFAGDNNYNASESGSVTINVARAASTTTCSPPAVLRHGDLVSAKVVPAQAMPPLVARPNSTVSFTLSSRAMTGWIFAGVDPSTGIASVPLPSVFTPGDYTILAEYYLEFNYEGSAAKPVNVVIAAQP